MASNDDLKLLITQINTENAVQLAELKEMIKTLTDLVAANKSTPKVKAAATETAPTGETAKSAKTKEQKPKTKVQWLKESFENDAKFREDLIKANPDVKTLFDKNATIQKKTDQSDRIKAEATYLAGTVCKNNVRVSDYVDAEYKKYSDGFGKQPVNEEPAPVKPL